LVAAMAHITGGGLVGNLTRAFPDGLGAVLDQSAWEEPRVISLLRDNGPVDEGEMRRAFNLDIGYCLGVRPSDAAGVVDHIAGEGIPTQVIGEGVEGDGVRFSGDEGT